MGELRPFSALARVLTRAAGPAALVRAAPPFAALLLFAAVAFGGNGMRPRDLCAVAAGSPAVRAALWAAWLLVTAPAARALLEAPSTLFLRALPVPPWQFWIVHGAHLLALQAPWILLFAAGAGELDRGSGGESQCVHHHAHDARLEHNRDGQLRAGPELHANSG